MSEYFDSKLVRRMRRLYALIARPQHDYLSTSRIVYDDSWANLTGEEFQLYLRDMIHSCQPFMLSRFGCGVLGSAIDYTLRLTYKTLMQYITGRIDTLDLQKQTIHNVTVGDGFYPGTHDAIMQYGRLICDSASEIDILASIMQQERFFDSIFADRIRCRFRDLESFHFTNPWTAALKGKKVLVIHPFVNTIRYQYEHNREHLFSNPDCLPEFDLILLRAVQDKKISVDPYDQYDTWFEAYRFLCAEIDKIDFDIAILGCGGFGMPLAAYVKHIGKQAIHMGGAVQYLFGIRSQRADTDENPTIRNMYNDFWIRPLPEDRPKGFLKIEKGCYW